MTKKKNIYIIVAVSMAVIAATIAILFATKIICIHSFTEATCTEPETCTNCGKTNGDPLGHTCNKWVRTKEPTCSYEGEEMCECETCREFVTRTVDKLPHTEGQWIISTPIMVRNDGTVRDGEKSLLCAVCGEVIRKETYTKELTTGEKNALKEAIYLVPQMHISYAYTIDYMQRIKHYSADEATFAADNCGANWDDQAIEKARSMANQGKSREKIISEMNYYKFTADQINKGLAAVGY